jgi:hypothetical protein
VTKKPAKRSAIDILKSATAEDWARIADKIVEMNRPVSSKWLVANGFPDDVVRACKIAVAELGDFATSQDVDEFPMDNIRELLQTCVDRRQWLAKINRPTSWASTVDHDRLKFYEDQKAKNQRLRYKEVAELWNKKEHDVSDETSFKQSCWRARHNVTK